MLIDRILLYKRRLFLTAKFGFEVLRPETAGAGINNYYCASIKYSVFLIYVVSDLPVYRVIFFIVNQLLYIKITLYTKYTTITRINVGIVRLRQRRRVHYDGSNFTVTPCFLLGCSIACPLVTVSGLNRSNSRLHY